MGQIIVTFLGICVHVERKNVPGLPCKHRVIMLANPEGAVLHGKRVLPHIPTLRVPGLVEIASPCVESTEDAGAYKLQGLTLTVSNTSDPYKLGPTFDEVPHLTPSGGRLLMDPEVILEESLPAVAYFDIDNGTLTACNATMGGAIGTHLTVETIGDPVLHLRCFQGGHDTPVTLPTHARVIILNTAIHEGDDDDDFLLSYEVCAGIPDNPVRPQPQTLPSCFPRTRSLRHTVNRILRRSFHDVPDDFGPGCSNSNYP